MIPAIEKVIERAVADSDDVVIEGVHLLPGLIDTGSSGEFFQSTFLFFLQMKTFTRKGS